MFPENWLRIKTLVPNLKFPGEWIVPRSYGNFIGGDPSPSGAPGAPCGAKVAMLAKTGAMATIQARQSPIPDSKMGFQILISHFC